MAVTNLSFPSFLIVIRVMVLLCSFSSLTSAMRYQVDLDEKYVLGWEVQNQDAIVFDVTVQTGGYVGLGISTRGKMNMADMVIGGVEDTGDNYFKSYFGRKHKPVVTRQQSWTLVEASKNGTHTFLKFWRPLIAKGSKSVPIKDEKTHVIWAIGKSSKLKKHHGHGSFVVNLIHPDLTPDNIMSFEHHDVMDRSAFDPNNNNALDQAIQLVFLDDNVNSRNMNPVIVEMGVESLTRDNVSKLVSTPGDSDFMINAIPGYLILFAGAVFIASCSIYLIWRAKKQGSVDYQRRDFNV